MYEIWIMSMSNKSRISIMGRINHISSRMKIERHLNKMRPEIYLDGENYLLTMLLFLFIEKTYPIYSILHYTFIETTYNITILMTTFTISIKYIFYMLCTINNYS